MPSLLATLGLDATSFQEKLKASQKMAGQVGKDMGSSLMGPIKQALGAFAAGMVVRDAFGMADRIKSLSNEFRVSAQTVQEWDIAAKRAGMSAEDMGAALNRLKKARAEAVKSGNLGGFAEFQIPMEALRDASISTEQILERMIEVAGSSDITNEQDVAGMDLMGKSGAKILSAFQQLHDLGPVSLLKDEEIERMHEAVDGFEDLKRTAASTAGKGFIAATEGPKSLWQVVKDLWNYANPRTPGPVFGGPGSDPFGGFTTTSTSEPDKLHGPITKGMSAQDVTEMKRTQLAIAEKAFQNELKLMTVEEKRAELKKEIAAYDKASEKAFEEGEWLTGYQERLKAEQLRSELFGLKDTNKATKPDVNSLERIGAYSRAISGDTDKAILSIEKTVRRIADRATQAPVIGGFG